MSKEKILTLENGTDVLSKISVIKHQVTLYNIIQHGRPELCYCESLKSCKTHEIYHYCFCKVKIIYIWGLKSMYIKIKKVKTEFSILLRYGAASLGDWGPKILEKHGGLICWGQPEDGSSMLSQKVWHHSPNDAVPHPRNMETSIDML